MILDIKDEGLKELLRLKDKLVNTIDKIDKRSDDG